MQRYSIALCALVFFSCAQAVPVRLAYHYDLAVLPSEDLVKDSDPGKSEIRSERIKYLVRLAGSSPSAVINNRAVELCLQGKFPESEILFLQIPASEKKYAAVVNNLGVLYECSGDRKKARDRYLEAAVLDPSCAVYRNNLRTVDQHEK